MSVSALLRRAGNFGMSVMAMIPLQLSWFPKPCAILARVDGAGGDCCSSV